MLTDFKLLRRIAIEVQPDAPVRVARADGRRAINRAIVRQRSIQAGHHQQHVIDLLREVCQAENVAMLLVTHSDEVAEQFERVDHLENLNRVMAVVR